MATAGSGGRVTRRSENHPSIAARPVVGTTLREARESQGITLAEVRDRTGVSWQHLEALEAMQLGRLPDQRSVVTAARRYAEVVGLDASEVCGRLLSAWQDQQWKPGHMNRETSSAGNTGQVERTESAGQNGHLRSFTQTAEVPLSPAQRARLHQTQALAQFADTGAIPLATSLGRGPSHGPRTLQIIVGVAALLLLLGIGGLAVAHYEPKWLSDMHLTHSAANVTTTTPVQARHHRPSSSSSSQSVIALPAANGSESVTVHSQSYQVLVAAQKPCWIDATGTAQSSGSAPVFEGVLQAGETKVLNPVNGALSIEFGASLVTVQVEMNGKTVPSWSFSPSTVPFTLSFTSS